MVTSIDVYRPELTEKHWELSGELRQMFVRLSIATNALAIVGWLVLAPGPGPLAVTDGDTIRVGDERVRLLGFDAPERKVRGR